MIETLFLIILSSIVVLSITYFYLYFYGKCLDIQTTILPDISKIIYPDTEVYKSYNPTLFKYNNKIYTIFRLAYGEIFSIKKTYVGLTGQMKNYPSSICIYNGCKLKTISIPDILKLYPEFKNIKYRLTGYEDPRAVIVENKLVLLVCCFANNNKYVQMALVSIELSEIDSIFSRETKESIVCSNFKLLNPSLNTDKYQKNWTPFIYNNQLYLIYSINPWIIFHCNIYDGKVIQVTEKKFNLHNFIRGGSNCIIYDSKTFGTVYLGIAHIRRNMYYTHIFYIFKNDIDFSLYAISNEFIFTDKHIKFINKKIESSLKFFINVQFAAGLLINSNKLLISYGESNVRSKICYLDLNHIDKILYLVN
jgi:predicted GH43/DUF377 family glycosyl hydrolase